MRPKEILQLDKYIEIKNLSKPQKAFERLENEFIDVMYPLNLSEQGVIMLLDVNIDPNVEEDIVWLKELVGPVLLEIGETEFFLKPHNPSLL